jgi:hypothetical protein
MGRYEKSKKGERTGLERMNKGNIFMQKNLYNSCSVNNVKKEVTIYV